MKIRIFISFLTLFYSDVGLAESRSFHLYAGGGLSKSMLNIERAGSTSKFEGLKTPVQVGMDIPFSKRFGFFVQGSYADADFKNSQDSDLKIETLQMSEKGLVAGFFLDGLGIGWGKANTKVKINQVSVDNGPLKYSADGNADIYQVHYIFDFEKSIRFSIEADFKSGEIDTYKYNDFSAGLKLFFIF